MFGRHVFSILLLEVLLSQGRQFCAGLANYDDKVQLAFYSIELLQILNHTFSLLLIASPCIFEADLLSLHKLLILLRLVLLMHV